MIEHKSPESILNLISRASYIFSEEPNYIELPAAKPIVFAGDTHGDLKSSKKVLSKYLQTHTVVFLGDYVDRAEKPFGSLENITFLLEKKIKRPSDIILLRGNHEDKNIFMEYGFGEELADFCEQDRENDISAKTLASDFHSLFQKMPYVASLQDVIAMHGGLPNISSADELRNIPKESNNWITSQIVWNDNTCSEYAGSVLNEEGFRYSNRGSSLSTKDLLLYGEPYFSNKMKLLGKNVLLRGHSQSAKGYSLNDRVLTIFTSQKYSSCGSLKGVYVAVMDPQKEIRTAKELDIGFL